MDEFLDFIERRNTRIMTIPDSRFIGFEDVIEIVGDMIRLTQLPEDLVFSS